MTWLVTHEVTHGLVGLAIGLALLRITGSRRALVVVVLWSLLIDTDHLVDYLVALGPTVDPSAIVGGTYFASSGHLYVPLHSWELAGILIVADWSGRRASWGSVALALGLATIGHLVVDQVVYAVPPGTYFLILRALHGFALPETW